MLGARVKVGSTPLPAFGTCSFRGCGPFALSSMAILPTTSARVNGEQLKRATPKRKKNQSANQQLLDRHLPIAMR